MPKKQKQKITEHALKQIVQRWVAQEDIDKDLLLLSSTQLTEEDDLLPHYKTVQSLINHPGSQLVALTDHQEGLKKLLGEEYQSLLEKIKNREEQVKLKQEADAKVLEVAQATYATQEKKRQEEFEKKQKESLQLKQRKREANKLRQQALELIKDFVNEQKEASIVQFPPPLKQNFWKVKKNFDIAPEAGNIFATMHVFFAMFFECRYSNFEDPELIHNSSQFALVSIILLLFQKNMQTIQDQTAKKNLTKTKSKICRPNAQETINEKFNAFIKDYPEHAFIILCVLRTLFFCIGKNGYQLCAFLSKSLLELCDDWDGFLQAKLKNKLDTERVENLIWSMPGFQSALWEKIEEHKLSPVDGLGKKVEDKSFLARLTDFTNLQLESLGTKLDNSKQEEEPMSSSSSSSWRLWGSRP